MASFILRDIDTKLWADVKAKAAREGHQLRWLLLSLLRAYLEKE